MNSSFSIEKLDNVKICLKDYKVKIKSMLDNKEVRIINNFVYTTSELTLIIKTWQDINNIKANINYNMAIDKYINAVESL